MLHNPLEMWRTSNWCACAGNQHVRGDVQIANQKKKHHHKNNNNWYNYNHCTCATETIYICMYMQVCTTKKKTKQSTTQQQKSTNEVNTTKYEISESVF